MARELLAWLASTKLAVVLLIAIALVLAVATMVEAQQGREYIQWYVYRAPWFAALLALLGLNIFAATLARFPWRRGHRGFLVTHAGVLLLLAGAMATFWAGTEGQLILEEGQSAHTIVAGDYSRLRTAWAGQHDLPHDFIFEPGPTDWPAGTTLKLHEQSGIRLEVLKFYRHARADEQWVTIPRPTASRPSRWRCRARKARPWSSSGSRPVPCPRKSTSVPCD